MVVGLLFGLVFFGVGGFLAYRGGSELRPVFHILRNDPVPVRDLHGHTGPVEIEGTARADEEARTVTAPFSGTDCLAYTYEVEELRSSGKNSSWETLAEGMDGVDFAVEDETGTVRVTPDGADVRLEGHTLTVSPGDSLPERIESFVESTEAVEKQDGTVDLLVTELAVGNKQRFTERRLDVGESAYVYGHARRDTTPEWGSDRVDAVVGEGRGAPVFVISDTGERGTAWRFVKSGVARLGIGLVFMTVATPFVFSVFGAFI
jgi:hypothetical protein